MTPATWPVTMVFLFLPNLLPFVTSTITHYDCLGSANYTSNSTYRANLHAVLATLPTNIDSNGFSYASSGRAPDRVNAIVLCRGDVNVEDCGECVRDAVPLLQNYCPNRMQGIIWYDDNECMVRYSNETIFGTQATRPAWYMKNNDDPINPTQFKMDLSMLLDTVHGQAVSGGSPRKFATRNMTIPDSETIFALAQCTPDLHPEDCGNCLEYVTDAIVKCCGRRVGARMVAPSCNVRFEIYLFFSVTGPEIKSSAEPEPPLPLPSPSPKGDNSSNKARTIIIVVPIASCSILIIFLGASLRMRRKQEKMQQLEINEAADATSTIESLHHDFSTIRLATNHFSDSNKLGQGGFGAVYKGKLPNGKFIAIKRLAKDSSQGSLEFKNEVLCLAGLQHRNLIKLLGFSIEKGERVLVYEFLANGSLHNFLSDPVKHSLLDWDTRHGIIRGIAKGLLYLHHNSRLKIIHRDIKPSNILLDTEMEPKIADFGLARLFGQDESEVNTKRIVGTYGYMPPESVKHGRFSVKSDVFSFGVLVLEIVNGQKNSHTRGEEFAGGILSFAWKNWRDGTPVDIVDPFLRSSSGPMHEFLRCIHIGLLCCQKNASSRPTMASVVLMLTDYSATLAVPSEPAFYFSSSERNPLTQSSEDASQNDVSITQLHPR